MAGPFHVIDRDGVELAGDMIMSENMRLYADSMGASVKDMSTGEIVYRAGQATPEED